MWKRELLKNKIYALALIGIGVLSAVIDGEVDFLLFGILIGVPLFFSKKNFCQ